MPENSQENLELGLAMVKAKSEAWGVYDNYYRGIHDLAFATDKFRTTFGRLFKAFADNLCPSVVDAVVDRLQVEGFGLDLKTGDQMPSGTDVSDEAWEIWKANRMDENAGQVHQEAVRQGNGYIMVWPSKRDEAKPTIFLNESRLIHIEYDEEDPGQMLWVSKAWKSERDGKVYLTLYYPDRIEKYVTRQKVEAWPDKFSAFIQRDVEGEPWPLPNPFQQIPWFHFRNNAPIGRDGDSELRDVKPIQDALNKSIADMLVAMEYVAMPQRYAVGLEIEMDEATGKPKETFRPGIDRFWAVADKDVKFGEFGQANLGQFLSVQSEFRFEVCRVVGMPLTHMLLLTNPPSGAALTVLEDRFVKKVLDRQTSFGNTWEDAMKFAIRVRRKQYEPENDFLMSCRWKDPNTITAKEQAEVQTLHKNLGVSEEYVLKAIGFSQAEIEEMQKQRSEAKEKELTMGAEILAKYETGGGVIP